MITIVRWKEEHDMERQEKHKEKQEIMHDEIITPIKVCGICRVD